jgi:succinoglycan biosynthesis protein ExoM
VANLAMTTVSGADFGTLAPKVAVCVVTYSRPVGLARLLSGLHQLSFTQLVTPDIVIIVVDNDTQRSGESVCTEWRSRLRWPLLYEHEPRRGIAQARNHALRAARSAEFVAFIDDDEVPDPSWLQELLTVQQRCGADVVCGPVLPVFSAEVPSWLCSFYQRTRYGTGDPLPSGSTNNTLVRRAFGDKAGVWFDDQLGLTGGEDTHFFRRLARLQARMVWADEATVQEYVPASRTTVAWVLRRAYRAGQTLGFCDRGVEGSFRLRAIRLAKGCFRVLQGLLMLPFGVALGREAMVRSLWRVCWGIGSITGLMGGQYQEYRNVDGT